MKFTEDDIQDFAMLVKFVKFLKEKYPKEFENYWAEFYTDLKFDKVLAATR